MVDDYVLDRKDRAVHVQLRQPGEPEDGRVGGVKNNLALKHLREMKPGDQVLVYHTGDEKAVVGIAEVVSLPYADPKQTDPKLAVVDLRAEGRLPRTVSLAEIKKDRAFADLALVPMGRLSVMPASADQFKRLLKLGGQKS